MNRDDRHEWVISTMGILKGRYFVMTAFNWSHHFWMDYKMGILLSSSKRWYHSVSSEEVIVRGMACVAWMSEQEFWYINAFSSSLSLPCTVHGITLIPSLTIKAHRKGSNAELIEHGGLTQLFWIQNGATESPFMFLTLIEGALLKHTANFPGRGNPEAGRVLLSPQRVTVWAVLFKTQSGIWVFRLSSSYMSIILYNACTLHLQKHTLMWLFDL